MDMYLETKGFSLVLYNWHIHALQVLYFISTHLLVKLPWDRYSAIATDECFLVQPTSKPPSSCWQELCVSRIWIRTLLLIYSRVPEETPNIQTPSHTYSCREQDITPLWAKFNTMQIFLVLMLLLTWKSHPSCSTFESGHEQWGQPWHLD